MGKVVFRFTALIATMILLGCGQPPASTGKIQIYVTGNAEIKAGKSVPAVLDFGWDFKEKGPPGVKVKVEIEADKGLTVTPSSFEVELNDKGHAQKIVTIEAAKDATGEPIFKITAKPEVGAGSTEERKRLIR